MPARPSKPCAHPGCSVLVRDRSGRCDKHQVAPGSFGDRSRGSRHERGYGSAWDKLREQIMRRDSGLCQPCGRMGKVAAAHHVDHIVPKAQGGTDDEANLQAICRDCHRAKTQAEANAGKGRGGSNL